ncbi:flagellar export chaperone FliS [Clostridium sp. Marseille-P299]|uniref:flagellar export chaperone FliS n=1 Tax=Clostridium sp. Marseille-P299 TaxID=1805477 RepID=UPI00082B3078|nr:flagellar export chaperone FliS [Clostridium sp. Marseille-P299]
MEKDKIQEFTLRVTQASKTELVVILYDILLSDIKEANRYFIEGDLNAYFQELKHAGKCVNELMATLDYRISLSRDLLSLYSYVNKTLIAAQMKKDATLLSSVVSVITKLQVAFSEISKQDTSGPVMVNTQQVYAGLTYGKGTLNESYLNSYDQNRGFKA